jgi:hypothetical protein
MIYSLYVDYQEGGTYLFMFPKLSLAKSAIIGVVCFIIGVIIYVDYCKNWKTVYSLSFHTLFASIYWTFDEWLSSSSFDIVYIIDPDIIVFLLLWITIRYERKRNICMVNHKITFRPSLGVILKNIGIFTLANGLIYVLSLFINYY